MNSLQAWLFAFVVSASLASASLTRAQQPPPYYPPYPPPSQPYPLQPYPPPQQAPGQPQPVPPQYGPYPPGQQPQPIPPQYGPYPEPQPQPPPNAYPPGDQPAPGPYPYPDQGQPQPYPYPYPPAAPPPAPPPQDEPPPPVDAMPVHVINGHALIPSLLVEYPIVSSYFGSTTGFGTARVDTINASGDTFTAKLATFAQGFQGGAALTDWLGLHIEAQGLMLIGTDQDSALLVGAQGQADFSGGALVRLLHGRSFVLSAGFSAGFGFGTALSPFAAVASAIDQEAINQDVLLTDISSWEIRPTLAFAFVPTSVFGLQASLGVNHSKETVEDLEPTTTTSVDLGVGIDLDGRSVFAPIAAQVAYQLSAQTQEGGETGHQIQLGLFYSGRPNLRLGASFVTNLASETLKTYVGLVQMHYFW